MDSILMADTHIIEPSRQISTGAASPTLGDSFMTQGTSFLEDLERYRSIRAEEQEYDHRQEPEISAQMIPLSTSREPQTGQTPLDRNSQSSLASHAPPLPNSPVDNTDTNANLISHNGNGASPGPFGMPFDPFGTPLALQEQPQDPLRQASVEFKTHREEALSIIQGVRNPSDGDALVALRDAQKTLRRMLELILKTKEGDTEADCDLDHPD